MAWVRLHDGAMTHPKIVGLSDKAFRLWVWGLSYSQQHLTDGAIPAVAVPGRLKRAAADLMAARLWDAVGADFTVHDYLDWNDSRATVTQKRTEAKARMANARERRNGDRRSGDPFVGSSQNVRANDLSRTSTEVLRRVGLGNTEASDPKKENGRVLSDDALGDRAHALLERYSRLYTKHRHGARLRLMHSNLEFQDALTLCQTWPDDRLDKLAVIVLTTDDDWISRTDRGFPIFVKKASWADGLLAEAEAKRA